MSFCSVSIQYDDFEPVPRRGVRGRETGVLYGDLGALWETPEGRIQLVTDRLFRYDGAGPDPDRWHRIVSSRPVIFRATGTCRTEYTLEPLPLDDAKELARRLIRQARDAALHTGVPWGGDVVQTDEVSLARINAQMVAFQAGLERGLVGWRMASDTVMQFTAFDFEEMARAVYRHVQGCYALQAEREAAIADATSTEAVEQYLATEAINA